MSQDTERARALLRMLRARDRELTGKLGEAYARPKDAGLKVRIPSATNTAHYRIPDLLMPESLVEIKNVKRQGLSRQILDFLLYAEQTGRRFVLFVRGDAALSKRLRTAIGDGRIMLRYLGPLFTTEGEAVMKKALMPMIWEALSKTYAGTQSKDGNV